MFTDTYRLIQLRIDEAQREAALERSVHAARARDTAILAADERPMAEERRPADEALIAAGERSDALLRTACCVETSDRAA